MHYPESVSRDAWRAERQALLQQEKEATRLLDAVAARRRRLPMTPVRTDYVFGSMQGPLGFVELFDGADQLIVYHNMLAPGSDFICPGCSRYSDHLGNLAHLRARRSRFVMVSRAPVARIEQVKARMGWRFPWVSCEGTSFHEDFVATEGESFGLSVFMRRGDAVYQSYFTSGRGVELPSNSFGLLDITPWGRQESWEDSPAGTPQEPAHGWVRLHDEYPRRD